MRPSETQVERSLADLLEKHQRCEIAVVTIDSHREDLTDEVMRAVRNAPEIRVDLLEGARSRLQEGDQPSADVLADRMVGRFICDRLR